MTYIWPPAHNCDEDLLEQTLYNSPDAYERLMDALYSDKPLMRKPSDPIWVTGLAAGFEQDYSALAVPLRVGDQPYGVITLAHSTPGRYGHEAQAMTTTFASYAAVAIENARLYDAAQEQAYASAALLQVAQAVVSLNDVDEILGTIIRILPILVGVERAALYQWDTEKDVFHPSQQYGLGEEDEEVFWNRSFAPGEFAFLDSCRGASGLMACPLEEGTRFTCLALAGSESGRQSWQPGCVPVRGSHRGQGRSLRCDAHRRGPGRITFSCPPARDHHRHRPAGRTCHPKRPPAKRDGRARAPRNRNTACAPDPANVYPRIVAAISGLGTCRALEDSPAGGR